MKKPGLEKFITVRSTPVHDILNTGNTKPRRAKLCRDKEEPRYKKSKMGNESSIFAIDRSNKERPKCRKSSTDIEEPACINDLNDTANPRATMFSTDEVVSRQDMPKRTDKNLTRMEVLTEIGKPRLRKSRTDRLESVYAKLCDDSADAK